MANQENTKTANVAFENQVNETRTLEQNVESFIQYGGFDLLEGAIEGVQNLNPERKARKNIFLSESSKKAERQALKTVLKLWAESLKTTDDLLELVNESTKKSEEAAKALKKNLATAVEESKELEENYRTLALFYKNTEESKVKNISIMNAELDQLKDLDNSRFIDNIQEELVNGFDRLDLRQNYSLLVIPGYLGSNKVIEKWAKIALIK